MKYGREIIQWCMFLSSSVSSIQDGVFVEDESELQVLETSSEHLVEQLSKSSISSSANKGGFEETPTEVVTLCVYIFSRIGILI